MRRSILLALRTWFFSCLFMASLFFIVLLAYSGDAIVALFIFPAALAASSPALFILFILGVWLRRTSLSPSAKGLAYTMVSILVSLPFAGLVITFSGLRSEYPTNPEMIGLALSIPCGVVISLLISRKQLRNLFPSSDNHSSYNTAIMETSTQQPVQTEPANAGNSSTLMKGLITGGLILLMLIPMIFVNNLVSERKRRQKEVADEVSSKWSSAQTLTPPYLYVPYTYTDKDKDGKPILVPSYFWIIPDELQVKGNLDHELRPRSIYKVLLYKARIQENGRFLFSLQKDIQPEQVKWDDIRVCISLSDFKGIESRVVVNTNNREIELSPGLPAEDIAEKGLSAPAGLTQADLGSTISFSATLGIKGSERLHFLPLGGNSNFELGSKWAAPSFDGNNLPSERKVGDSGFSAKWSFNKANLPFGTLLREGKKELDGLAFGVTMVQPADQYSKTERTVKYAILVIGLTFSLFFITELMQKKSLHPMQYVLIGLALVIFYTLLLSISEFVLFDIAYAVAAFATVALIVTYVRAHFGNWKAPGIIGSTLVMLYVFIFVLVRLEDTALLIGSIGLFFILAIAMYLSRKINWY